MQLGIFGRPLGNYAAPPARQAHIDLGPESTAADFENRQTFTRGLNAYLQVARSGGRSPLAPSQSSPELVVYQQAVQDLNRLDPALAAELSQQAGTIGVMRERQLYRPFLFGRRALMGIGYILVPPPMPGAHLVDLARAGTRARGRRVRLL